MNLKQIDILLKASYIYMKRNVKPLFNDDKRCLRANILLYIFKYMIYMT